MADTEGSQFTGVSDFLHRKTTDQNGRPYLQIVLPADRRAEIIKIAHSTPMAGLYIIKKQLLVNEKRRCRDG